MAVLRTSWKNPSNPTIVLVSGTDRQVIAKFSNWNAKQKFTYTYRTSKGKKKKKKNVKCSSTVKDFHYEWSYLLGGKWQAADSGEISTSYLSVNYTAPENATAVRCKVYPRSKTFTNYYKSTSGKGRKKKTTWKKRTDTFFGSLRNIKWSTHYFKNDKIATPQAPEVTVGADGLTITATAKSDDADTSRYYFYIYQNGAKTTKTVNKKDTECNVSFKCSAGKDVQVSVKVYGGTKGSTSGESAKSTVVRTKPTTPGKPIAVAYGEGAKVTYTAAQGSGITYKVQYANDRAYLVSGSGELSEQESNTAECYIDSLNKGDKYFFRVKAINSDDLESSWSEISDVLIVGTIPDPPTTYSSASSVIRGESVTLGVIHNSADGSAQEDANIYFSANFAVTDGGDMLGNWTRVNIGKNSTYVLDTSIFNDGDTVYWYAQTKGVLPEFSQPSETRSFSVWEQPELAVYAYEAIGSYQNALDTTANPLTSLPLKIQLDPSTTKQTPVAYDVSIVTTSSYAAETAVEGEKVYAPNTPIWSAHYDDVSDPFYLVIGAGEILLDASEIYAIHATVAMNSGLRATNNNTQFAIDWGQDVTVPTGTIDADEDDYTVTIIPWAEIEDETTDGLDIDEAPESDGDIDERVYDTTVKLSVYRINADGLYTKLAYNIKNNGKTAVVDPHPTLGRQRYRIVAESTVTGQQSWSDIEETLLDNGLVVFQWDEEWTPSVENEDGIEYTGSIVTAPYNIELSETGSKDVALIEYLGRDNPVAHYGTQRGVTGSWSCGVLKADTETIEQVRAMQAYMGAIYARQPYGVGYWANVDVDISSGAGGVTNITFDVTKIDKEDEATDCGGV